MEKIKFSSSGQWSLHQPQPLKKSNDEAYTVPSGTHTVELHPDMDHLYRMKGAIKDSGKPGIKKGELKKQGFDDNLLKRTPDNGQGLVTADMIDKHIAGLPKHKVNVNVDDYKMDAQQHRDGPQKVFSVNLHPDTIDKMKKEDPKAHEAWEAIKGDQHDLGDGNDDQLGWGRVDLHSKPSHWHVDEIQSDFQNKDKLKNKADNLGENIPGKVRKFSEGFGDFANKAIEQHPNKEALQEKLKPYDHSYHSIEHAFDKDHGKWAQHHTDMVNNLEKEGIKVPEEYKKPMGKEEWDKLNNAGEDVKNHVPSILKHLSGNHEDPQHLVHSAINALARKHNAKSTSMDMPVDQIIQSGLSNPHMKSGLEKIGGTTKLRDAILSKLKPGNTENGLNKLLESHKDKLSREEYKTIKSLGEHLYSELPRGDLLNHHQAADDEAHKKSMKEYSDHLDNSLDYHTSMNGRDGEVPVHQRDTYDKRPKKLGMKPTNKEDVMGPNHNEDPEDQVQYSKVYKSLQCMVYAASIHKDEERLAKALNWIEKLTKQRQ